MEYNESDARLFGQYARASFCTRVAIEEWACGGPCSAAPILPGTARFLGPGQMFGVQGYVARLPASTSGGHACVAAFRGTSNYNLGNLLADMLIWRVRWSPPSTGNKVRQPCSDCMVLAGYAAAYAELKEELFIAIANLSCSAVTVTGHSLGAGIATLASMDLRISSGVLVDAVWTFGKPRIGNQAFVEAYMAAAQTQNVQPPLWRVVHYHDVIPRLPWHVLGYHHESLEVYYTEEDSSSYRLCPPTDEHLEDPSCMLATPWYRCGMHDHTKYYLQTLDFEEADFNTECIPVQPSPVPMLLVIVLFCGIALVVFCRVCRWRSSSEARGVVAAKCQRSTVDTTSLPLLNSQ